METLQMLFDNGAVIVAALVAIISSVSSIITLWIDESKVSKYTKPVLKVLNLLALNVFKNKNATDK